ncbi:MAG: hypothetical protein M3157_06960 [Actinomycetota bacterium]|nr:hypothetical protein [Actinomycetota bacterium]
MFESDQEPRFVGYEFAREEDARYSATELDRRFTGRELRGLRIYRVRWSGNYLVEATFAGDVPDSRVQDARALLGEAGTPVHPDDLRDYKRATEAGGSGLPGWIRKFFGQRY